MSTAPSLALRSLLTGVLRETGLSSPPQRISGATPPVRALAVAAAAKRLSDGIVLLVVPTDAEIESTVGDISFFSRCSKAPQRPWSSSRSCRSHRRRSIPIAAFSLISRWPPPARECCTRWPADTARVIVASAAALLTKLARSGVAAAGVVRDQARHRYRPARAGEHTRARRLRAGRSGRCTRRVQPAGRHLRRVSGRRGAAGPHRVHRRHGRIHSPLRSRHAALGRNPRSLWHRPSPRSQRLSTGIWHLYTSNLFQFLRTRDAAGLVV